MRILFITGYMKFRQLQLTIFRNLLQSQRFRVDDNVRGRPKIKDLCNVFKSILFKVKSGVNWEDTRCYSNYSASTVYKYFKQWCSNNLFEELYRCSLSAYSSTKRIRWKYQSIDSTIIKAYRGGEAIGRNSTDRGRNGSKIHTLADKNGIPLAFIVTEANYHDSRSVPILLQKYQIRRPRYHQHMNLDSAYDTRAIKRSLILNQFQYHIPRNRRNSRRNIPRMSEEDKIHYKHRITIEHQFGHLKQFKSIIIRRSRKLARFTNLINIAYSSIICNKM